MIRNVGKLALVLTFATGLFSCGIQTLPQAKNEVEATLAEVTNQYKRRSDLVPNLVSTVKGFAAQEQETLTAVVEARAKATQATIDPNQMSAEKLAEFQKAQGALSSALGRLMVVVEKYPDLKSNQNFLELQAQLEGTENRITVARNRHIEAIKAMNNLIMTPPSSFTNSLFYRFEKLPQWDVAESEKATVDQAPKVEF